MYRETLHRKKRKKDIRQLLSMAIFLCIITLILAVGSRLFAIKKITIVGNDQITTDRIHEAVSIFHGRNLLKVKNDSIHKLLTGVLPIKETKVSYKLPDTLIIDVVEREVVVAINYPKGFVLVDECGVVVAVEQKITDYPIPVITGLEIKEAEIAKQPVFIDEDIPYDMLMDLVALLRYMASELSEIHFEIDVENNVHFQIYTLDGYTIYLGDFDIEKLAILKDILDDVRENSQEKGILDMSFKSPIFKPFSATDE